MNNKNFIAFVCYIIASICFYISAIIGIFSKESGNWITNMCLGSAFLGLASTHFPKRNNDKNNNNK